MAGVTWVLVDDAPLRTQLLLCIIYVYPNNDSMTLALNWRRRDGRRDNKATFSARPRRPCVGGGGREKEKEGVRPPLPPP